jgi:hypothetical protein
MAASLGPWPARATWALLPLLLGPALGDALDERSGAVATTGSGMAWATWAVVLGATVLPRALGLTVLRVVAPLALAVAMWAGVAADQRAVDALAVAWSALVVVAAFAPTTGDAFANGSSYGDERRILLRVPTPLLLGPLPLAWAALVGPALAAPLLLAAEQWVQGALALAVAVPAVVLAGRAVHGLARRWVVFVPAGVVLHDLHAMVDPVLFPRARIARLGPAPAAPLPADGLDLTVGALGLVLQLDLREPLEVAPRRPDRTVKPVPLRAVRFAPTRPGAVLAEARARRLPVA